MSNFGLFRGFGEKLFQAELPTNLGMVADDFDDPDYTSFYSRVIAAGGTLTSEEQLATNELVLDLKTNLIWDKIKVLLPMVGSSAASCAQNLKSSNFTATFNGGFTYSADGVKSNGTTGFINTNLNASIDLTTANCHMSFYQQQATNNNINGIYYGPNFFIYFQSATSVWCAIGNGDSTTTTTNRDGMHTLTAVSSAAKLFRNTTNLTSFTSSSSFPNFDVYINSGNTFAAPNTYGNGIISYVSLGLGLTDSDVSNLYTAIQKFNTSLSRQI